MKHRQTILLVLTAAVVGGYWVHNLRQDTLASASDRLGKALLASDTDTIWTFVPEDERAFYGFDKAQFSKFWTEVIAPDIKQFDSYTFQSEDLNGLEVTLVNSKADLVSNRVSWLVSGQLGHYYVPFIVAYSSLGVAGQDQSVSGVEDYVRFEKYIHWLKLHEAQLQDLGIGKMRRGAAMQEGQSLDAMIQDFRFAIKTKKEFLTVASR